LNLNLKKENKGRISVRKMSYQNLSVEQGASRQPGVAELNKSEGLDSEAMGNPQTLFLLNHYEYLILFS
jgi:hypothetical protein